MNKILEFKTESKFELVNITKEVGGLISQTKIDEGICLVFVPHSTAAILVNEDEAGFKADIEKLVERWIPENGWQHDKVDDNATSHLGAALIGQSRAIPIKAGDLQLGTWQEVFLVELDGPRRNRKVVVQIVSSK